MTPRPTQAAGLPGTDILMYHSISAGAPPLCTPPATFRTQLDVLADTGYRGVSLAEHVDRRDRTVAASEPYVVLTFDDGYDDFARVAAPEILARGWSATVFLPSGLVGSRGALAIGSRRIGPFLEWDEAAELARSGIELGAHGVTHADLTALPHDTAAAEIGQSGDTIAERTGRPVGSFAPPFGRSSAALRSVIAARYRCAAGATMRRATASDDPYDLPRIEMCYFGRVGRWRDYVERGGSAYATTRRLLRAARRAVTGGRPR